MSSSLESRLQHQLSVASSNQHPFATSASSFSANASSSHAHTAPSNLPSSSQSTNLRPATAATLTMGASYELNPLDWAQLQFQRAGVNHSAHQPSSSSSSTAPSASTGGGHHTPIQNLGLQQRMRHAQLFSIVDKLREGQQHIFLDQFNQFPNVESHTAADYSKIWHSFSTKDEEAQHIIAKLHGLCDHIDTLNRHANNPHA